MKLNDYKLMFVAVGLIGIILISCASALSVVHLPSGEKFSELYILGRDDQMNNYPLNVSAGQNYFVYPYVRNHLGTVAYYEVVVKLGNLSELLPEETSYTPSALPVLYEYKFILNVWPRVARYA